MPAATGCSCRSRTSSCSRATGRKTDAQLDRLGSTGWQTRKARLKKRVREMAGELIRVAAARQLRGRRASCRPKGSTTSSARASPMTKRQDQAARSRRRSTISAPGRPMDRLVCGDVGFGKTEVALRAAFAAAINGKQTAIVAPTTLLARQHSRISSRVSPACRCDRPAFAHGRRGRAARGQEGARRGRHRHRRRHPCGARQDRRVQGPRPRGDRRGAAFRRRSQGAAEGIARRSACADAVGDADPAHLAACDDRRARISRSSRRRRSTGSPCAPSSRRSTR